MGAGGGNNFGATKNVVNFMDNLLKLAEYYLSYVAEQIFRYKIRQQDTSDS